MFTIFFFIIIIIIDINIDIIIVIIIIIDINIDIIIIIIMISSIIVIVIEEFDTIVGDAPIDFNALYKFIPLILPFLLPCQIRQYNHRDLQFQQLSH